MGARSQHNRHSENAWRDNSNGLYFIVASSYDFPIYNYSTTSLVTRLCKQFIKNYKVEELALKTTCMLLEYDKEASQYYFIENKKGTTRKFYVGRKIK